MEQNTENEKYQIVYGYKDETGMFVKEDAVDLDELEEEEDADDNGLFDSKESATQVATSMNKVAEDFYNDDKKQGIADPKGPVVHKAIRVRDTKNVD